jgi:hypothetical protein
MNSPSYSESNAIPRLSWPLAIARAVAALALLSAAGWLIA